MAAWRSTSLKFTQAIAAIALATLPAACDSEKSAVPKPAKTEALAHETELLKITLTDDAVRRLGLQVVPVQAGSTTRTVVSHGEIVVPTTPGGIPTSTQTDLTALAAAQVRADGDVGRARAEMESAQKIADRAAALLKEDAGSVRADDDAQTALAVARANFRAAQGQRALLGSSPMELGRGAVWVRVPIFASDVGRIDRGRDAIVRSLGGDTRGIVAKPVPAPPTANAIAGTVDFYYVVSNANPAFHVGQRVAVDLPANGQTKGLTIPTSAILHDAYGGEWVYVRLEGNSFERRRIQIGSYGPNRVLLTRGLAPGDAVVVAGAAELFGTEFGSK